MWYKQQMELAILPRIFKGIKICYKGEYSFRFELVHQSENGKKKSAYPYIFQPSNSTFAHEKKETEIKKSVKKARTELEDNRGLFETKHFHIEYESHMEYLNDLCVFKLEYKMKKSKGKTFLLIQLLSHRSVINQNKESNKLELKKITKVVDSQKLNINRFNQDLHNFVEIEFLDNDYFSTISMYIGSVHLGWKVRANSLSLCQFLCEDPKEKKRIIQVSKKYLSTQDLVGKFLRQITKQHCNSSQQFYRMTVEKSIREGKRVNSAWRNINLHSQYPQSMTNLNEQFSFFINLDEDYFNQENISQYYQASDINYLYFSIHYENQMIIANVRFLWQKLLEKLKKLSVDQFQNFSIKSIRENDRKWMNICTKFISNQNYKKRIDYQVLSRDKSCQVFLQKQSILKNSKHSRSSINIQEFKGKKEQKKQNSSKIFLDNGSELKKQMQILQIRSKQIQNFKQWRLQYLKNQKVYFDSDIEHPFLIFQNYTSHIPLHRNKKGLVSSLVVFIHGFKGSEVDLEKASQYLMKYNQNVDILRINTLQPDIDYEIQQMASIVAIQIKKYINSSISKIQSISIVGYSLGGVIGRACLRYLDIYRAKMNIFVTFSSPHLGTFVSDNKFVKLGIWYLTKMNKNTMLEQLHTCRDIETSSKSYMKQLSERNHISWFKKIILVSCQQDQFVPHLSSRIDEILPNEFHNFQQDNNKFQCQIGEMSRNILRNAQKIQRVQVWFDNQKKKGALDKITGRHSHIQFLDNNSFLKWFFQVYGKQF